MGDVCEQDTDNDGVIDRLDNCPKNPALNTSNFKDYLSINLDPTSTETNVSWMILFDGAEIRQAQDTNASAILLSMYESTWLVNLNLQYSDQYISSLLIG